MKQQHSIGSPVRWTMSAIGWMSAASVRAAQFACTLSRQSTISRGKPLDVLDDVRARAGQADVRGIDADAIEQVQDPQLLIDGGRLDRRRLEAVPQRLVVEQDRGGRARSPF